MTLSWVWVDVFLCIDKYIIYIYIILYYIHVLCIYLFVLCLYLCIYIYVYIFICVLCSYIYIFILYTYIIIYIYNIYMFTISTVTHGCIHTLYTLYRHVCICIHINIQVSLGPSKHTYTISGIIPQNQFLSFASLPNKSPRLEVMAELAKQEVDTIGKKGAREKQLQN